MTTVKPAAAPCSTSIAISQAELLTRIRDLRAQAHQTGRRLPGRPTLAAMIGVSAYRVRRALEELAREERLSHRAGGQLASQPHTSPNGARALQRPAEAAAANAVDQASPALRPLAARATSGHGCPDTAASTVQPPLDHDGRRTSTWPLVIIGLAAAISVWSGWVGLGQLAGFGVIQPLPGVWDDLHLNTAIVLPISVEAYAAYALRCWLTRRPITPQARRFARCSAIVSLVIGAAAQVAFHLMTAAGMNQAPWPVTVGVATIPVMVLGLATALTSLIRDVSTQAQS